VLFLDEPTTGLDPAARLFVWDRLRELQAQGVTLFLTTHDMDEAAALADRVGIMDHGRLLALDAPDALIRSLPGKTTLEIASGPVDEGAVPTVQASLAALPEVERVERLQQAASPEAAGPAELRLRLYVSADAPLLVAPVATALAGHGLALTDVRLGIPSLEDVFIELTGRTLRG
jgi:ABC-2 type transport system ATP-binding protein